VIVRNGAKRLKSAGRQESKAERHASFLSTGPGDRSAFSVMFGLGQRGLGLFVMKVLEGLRAIEPGTIVPVGELGLPVAGTKGLLLVFWKST
jgi:hypothetical protein